MIYSALKYCEMLKFLFCYHFFIYLLQKIVIMMNICYSMYHLYCNFILINLFIFVKIVYHCNIYLYHI